MSRYNSKPTSISELLNKHLRQSGLETPLLQRRLLNSWGTVVGEQVDMYTEEKYIRNQTLYVKIAHAALRADLSMMRKQLVQRLNEHVGGMVIADIKFY